MDGQIPVERVLKYPTRHLHLTRAIKYWRAFEEAVGIDHVDGRSFYGLRRGLTDTANGNSTDDRILDRLTGHQDSETRKAFYQDQERAKDRAEAARVRRQMRLDLSGATAIEPPEESEADLPEDVSLRDLLAHLDPKTRARVLKQLSRSPGVDDQSADLEEA